MQKEQKHLRQLVIIILLTVTKLTCVGQGLFFDNLEKTTWTSDNLLNDTNIANGNGFGLTILSVSKDSINVDCTIWTFRDSLTVTYYDASLRQESVIGKYQYKHDQENSLLLIMFDQNEPSAYTVGIVSTGSFAMLTKKKLFKKKARTHNRVDVPVPN